MKVDFFLHSLQAEDREAVDKVLQSIFLTTGKVTQQFEEAFSTFTGQNYTVATSSCTGALHLALIACGIKEGDEVITTPMTFIATATAIMHAGATPIFVDVEENSGLIDVNLIESKITSRTKAILPVHLYGGMVDMLAIRKIADQYQLKVIEDCAHCIEAERDGIRPGQLSDAACYSFYATKNLTSGEGGALTSNHKDVADQVRILRTHGMNKDASSRYTDQYQHWDMVSYGWKYNMDSIHASLLIHQIDRLESQWEKRKTLWERYTSALNKVPFYKLPIFEGKNAYHLYTIWVPPEHRDKLLTFLQNKEIGVAVNYRSIHNLTYLKERFNFKPDDFPISNKIGDSTLSIPLYPMLTLEKQDYVIQSLEEYANLVQHS